MWLCRHLTINYTSPVHPNSQGGCDELLALLSGAACGFMGLSRCVVWELEVLFIFDPLNLPTSGQD